MIRTVRNLLTIDPGFRADGVLTMRISTPSLWYPDAARVVAFWDEVQRRVSALPGVKQTAAVRLLPLATEMGDWGLNVEGYTPPPNQGTPGDWQVVTPGYFETLRLSLREGRAFTASDGKGGSCTGTMMVGVPHDQGQGAIPIDDGQIYDSTVP